MEQVGVFITIGGAVGAGAVIWQKALRPGLRATRAAYMALAAVHELIEAQLRPNGGTSLVDRVGRIEIRQDETEHHVSCIRRHLGAREEPERETVR